MVTLIYIWNAPGAELARWPMAISAVSDAIFTAYTHRLAALRSYTTLQRYTALYSAIHYTAIHTSLYTIQPMQHSSENRIRAAHDPCGASMRARRFLDAESSLSLSYAFKGRYQGSSSWLLRTRGAHSERRLLRAQPPPACHPAIRRTQGSRVAHPVLVYVAGV